MIDKTDTGIDISTIASIDKAGNRFDLSDFIKGLKELKINNSRIFALKKKIAKQKPWDPIIISDNLTWSEFSRVNLFLHEFLPKCSKILEICTNMHKYVQ